jgi:1-acyl-sn-glycerol-3-phosphate acyltransferase
MPWIPALRDLSTGNPSQCIRRAPARSTGACTEERRGVAWLALTANVPVVPVALTGTDKIQPVGTKGIRLAKLRIEYGQPMDLSSYGEASSGKARRDATDAIMAEIQKMSGQEFAGVYNEKPATTIKAKVRRLFRGRAPLT